MAYLGYACAVPHNLCSGKAIEKSGGRYHSTVEACFKCKEKYLISQGYEKLNNRHYRDPKGGVLVLDRKQGKVGKVRKGKEGRAMKSFHSIVGF